MAIKSGTLRRKIDECIRTKTICDNLLLLLLAYLKIKPADNSDRIKLYADMLLKYSRLDKDEIINRVHSIKTNKDYILSDGQAEQAMIIFDNALQRKTIHYNRYFIKDRLLKCYDSKKNYKSSAKNLKAYILENDLIETILDKLGCTEIQLHSGRGDNYYSACNPNGDNKNAVCVYCCKNLNVVNYTRNLSIYSDNPDIITLIQYYTMLDYREAIDWLLSALGMNDIDFEKYETTIEDRELEEEREEREEKRKQEQEEKYKQALAKDLQTYSHSCNYTVCDDWFKEAILTPIAKEWGVKTLIREHRVAIPIRHYSSGEIIAISFKRIMFGLCDNEENEFNLLGIPKYLITAGYNKHENIYGLYENKQNILDKGYMVIFEAEKSVLKRATMQDRTAVAIQGHNLTDEQASIISELNLKEIIIAFDKDVLIQEVLFFCQRLLDKGCKKVSYIQDNEKLLGEKDSPADKGDKIYKYLFENRKEYKT